jgi:hypothetical protein
MGKTRDHHPRHFSSSAGANKATRFSFNPIAVEQQLIYSEDSPPAISQLKKDTKLHKEKN